MDDVEQDWGRDPEDRWVRLMSDFCASGVWHRNGVGDLPESLPIPRALGARIYRWQDWYDELERDNEPGTDWEMTADWPIHTFAEEGRAIARSLKAELPSDWTVVYLDLAAVKQHGGWGSLAPRRLWEYEIPGDT